jgi:hypothetical protein
VDIIDSFMISRRVSVAEMLHTPRKNHEWSRSCGTPVREAGFLNRVSSPCGASHCVESVGGVQVTVVTGRGCGHALGVRSLSYQAEISRASPTAIVMVMDQSASMNHRLKSGQSKAVFLADAIRLQL